MASVKEYVQSVVNAIGAVNTTLTTINAQDVPNKIRELKVEANTSTAINPTGTYDKIFLNTNLTNDEVTNLIKDLSFVLFDQSDLFDFYVYAPYILSDFSNNIVIMKVVFKTDVPVEYYSIGRLNTNLEIDTQYWSYGSNIDNVGWQEFDNPLSFTTVGGIDNFDGLAVGQQNDLIKNLISATPFNSKQLLGTYDGSAVEVTEAGVVDIGAMLDEGKLPLEVNVNVASGGEDMLQARVDATNSCLSLFYNFRGTNVDFIKNLDTSNVDSMQGMFGSCYNLVTIPPLNTSKVTIMQDMFSQDSNLETISQLDTSNVTNMSGMFNGCRKILTIPPLNTSKVINMNNIFCYCSKLETAPQLDLISIESDYGQNNIFRYCSVLKTINLKNIKFKLQISDGTSWGHLLTLDSLINTCKELINTGSARTLTMGTTNLEKIANTYVKFVDSSQTSIARGTKGDVVVCESTDAGAMLLSDYALLKNWTLA